ncbi:thioredoxin family protein [Maribacter luteus]|uniref:Thioredoxin fold domain-containing protein n=1 Tax=Maribacter luteus TaxID=2594478 RepID=A0A6I2MLE4_9FLAO|nr:thioredoxin family protein [Maribacter luteus]MRX64631.1 thioredoxin fold domain-containing protein [Maribacter luteus]|tara:strand:- start:809 stop:1261 length:453 start_codon:yes stop_codon:yes gene_type:complete
MKSILLLLIVPFFISTQNYLEAEKDTKWLTDYEKAIKRAKKEDKNVLVYFTGSDWCPPCKMLKTDLFESAEFKALAEDYVLLYVDMPRNKDLLTHDQLKHNKELLKKYNKKGVFPLLTIVNEKGNALDEYSGYSMNGEIRYHLQLLNKYK